MSEDLTKKHSNGNGDAAIIAAIKNLDSHVRSSVDNLVTWISSVDGRLKGLEEKVEQRLHDTPPIWNKVAADIAQLQTGQDAMRSEQDAMRADIGKLTKTVEELSRNQGVFNDAIRKTNKDLDSIDERLHRLEVNRNPRNSST